MKYLALAIFVLGVYLVKRATLPKSFQDGSFLLGVLGLICIAVSLIIFLALIFLAL